MSSNWDFSAWRKHDSSGRPSSNSSPQSTPRASGSYNSYQGGYSNYHSNFSHNRALNAAENDRSGNTTETKAKSEADAAKKLAEVRKLASKKKPAVALVGMGPATVWTWKHLQEAGYTVSALLYYGDEQAIEKELAAKSAVEQPPTSRYGSYYSSGFNNRLNSNGSNSNAGAHSSRTTPSTGGTSAVGKQRAAEAGAFVEWCIHLHRLPEPLAPGAEETTSKDAEDEKEESSGPSNVMVNPSAIQRGGGGGTWAQRVGLTRGRGAYGGSFGRGDGSSWASRVAGQTTAASSEGLNQGIPSVELPKPKAAWNGVQVLCAEDLFLRTSLCDKVDAVVLEADPACCPAAVDRLLEQCFAKAKHVVLAPELFRYIPLAQLQKWVDVLLTKPPPTTSASNYSSYGSYMMNSLPSAKKGATPAHPILFVSTSIGCWGRPSFQTEWPDRVGAPERSAEEVELPQGSGSGGGGGSGNAANSSTPRRHNRPSSGGGSSLFSSFSTAGGQGSHNRTPSNHFTGSHTPRSNGKHEEDAAGTNAPRSIPLSAMKFPSPSRYPTQSEIGKLQRLQLVLTVPCPAEDTLKTSAGLQVRLPTPPPPPVDTTKDKQEKKAMEGAKQLQASPNNDPIVTSVLDLLPKSAPLLSSDSEVGEAAKKDSTVAAGDPLTTAPPPPPPVLLDGKDLLFGHLQPPPLEELLSREAAKKKRPSAEAGAGGGAGVSPHRTAKASGLREQVVEESLEEEADDELLLRQAEALQRESTVATKEGSRMSPAPQRRDVLQVLGRAAVELLLASMRWAQPYGVMARVLEKDKETGAPLTIEGELLFVVFGPLPRATKRKLLLEHKAAEEAAPPPKAATSSTEAAGGSKAFPFFRGRANAVDPKSKPSEVVLPASVPVPLSAKFFLSCASTVPVSQCLTAFGTTGTMEMPAPWLPSSAFQETLSAEEQQSRAERRQQREAAAAQKRKAAERAEKNKQKATKAAVSTAPAVMSLFDDDVGNAVVVDPSSGESSRQPSAPPSPRKAGTTTGAAEDLEVEERQRYYPTWTVTYWERHADPTHVELLERREAVQLSPEVHPMGLTWDLLRSALQTPEEADAAAEVAGWQRAAEESKPTSAGYGSRGGEFGYSRGLGNSSVASRYGSSSWRGGGGWGGSGSSSTPSYGTARTHSPSSKGAQRFRVVEGATVREWVRRVWEVEKIVDLLRHSSMAGGRVVAVPHPDETAAAAAAAPQTASPRHRRRKKPKPSTTAAGKP